MDQLLSLLLLLPLCHGVEWFGQCIKNSGNTVSLPVKLWTNDTNSPEICIQSCRDHGFAYAGVQDFSECYCGNSPSLESAIMDSSVCKYICKDDNSQSCGGRGEANVFETKSKFLCFSFYVCCSHQMGWSVCGELPTQHTYDYKGYKHHKHS